MAMYSNIMKPNQFEQPKAESLTPTHSAFKIFQNCDNPYLIKLLDHLKKYYQEKEAQELKGIPIQHKQFKSTIFQSLEELLFQISAIHAKELRDLKLLGAYQWFNKRYSYYDTISHITDITSPHPTQKYTDQELGIFRERDQKDENYAEHHSILSDIEKPKEILKKYMVKKINTAQTNSQPNDNNVNLKVDQGEKNGMSATFGNKTFRSTDMRTTLNSTIRSQKFFPVVQTRLNAIIDPLHETKFSYSFYRPKYSFAQLHIESDIIKAKNKALSDKRAQDELISAVNDFGFCKSSMNKSLLHKHDLKDLILQYKKKAISQDTHHLIKQEKEKILNKNPGVKKISRQMSTTNISPMKIKDNLNRRESKSNVSKKKKTTNIIKRELSYASNDLGTLMNLDHKNKLTTDNIMNVNTKGQLEPNKKEEMVYNIRMRVDSVAAFQENYDRIKRANGKLPNDLICRRIQSDEIPLRRLLSETMTNIKRIDHYRDGYSRHYQPMSRFDMIYSSSFKEFRSRGHITYRDQSTPRTACGYSNILYDDNHLTMRRTLNSFKQSEVNMLCTSLKYNDSQWSKSSIKNAFMSPEKETIFPRTYFPKSGSSFLKIPKCLLKDKKNKKKKK